MRHSKAYAFLLIGLFGAGCASQPETVAVPVAPEPEPQAQARPKRPQLVAPEKDPRYQLPKAKSRALSIHLDSQTFEYVEDGRVFASGEVSTGSKKHPTPKGKFRVQSKDKDKRSSKYTNYYDQNTPMPYSLQFHGPYFIHEGYMPGHPDSHGCVRLHYEDARLLFTRMKVGDSVVVKKEGVARSADPTASVFPVF